MEVFYQNQEKIEYELQRKEIKNCYITVKNGEVKIRAPKRISQVEIEKMLAEKMDWILGNVKKQKQKAQMPKKYVDGEIFKVLGKEVILRISYEKVEKPQLKFALNQLKIMLPIEKQVKEKEQIQKLINSFYQKLAEKEVKKAMEKMVDKVGVAPKQYKIKSLKSTWGNCSSAENISINQNVVMYSQHCIEYVCLHEICHLKNMDHSKKFWNMVKRYMPDYKKAEEELKLG